MPSSSSNNKGPSLKARLARAFLNFLDEHGDYRSELEEAAARAAAAEANSLFAKDRLRDKKKKKKRRGKLGGGADGEEGEYDEYEELYDEIDAPHQQQPEEESTTPTTTINKSSQQQLPDDPYEQIQFYFATFKHRTSLQIQDKVTTYQNLTTNWLHTELHHPFHIPLLSGGMLLTTLTLYLLKLRNKKLNKLIRVHSILGKKFNIKDYIVTNNILLGRLLLQYTSMGNETILKLTNKASKAEDAALSSMRPYARKKYIRYKKLEYYGDLILRGCLIMGVVCSGITFLMSLGGLVHQNGWGGGGEMNVMNGTLATNGTSVGEERLDGHIYSYDGPIDSDGYPIGMRELAEEKYAMCVSDAEERGIENPNSICNVESFFDEEQAAKLYKLASSDEVGSTMGGEKKEEEPTCDVVTSPLRSKIHNFLTSKLHVPQTLSSYLTTLRTQTLAYLTSFFTFLLFLTSHYIAHKIHLATLQNDPMKHFVISATDKSVKADGTVEAKKGETEAQRKRRERMLQNELLKSKMAQLAMEAKQRVEERRKRIEGAAAVEKEKEEKEKKVVEEQEEIVKAHSRQYMMIKAGVPEGAILNSFLAMGMDDEDENKTIIDKLRAIKERRALEAKKLEEDEAKKIEDAKKLDEEKEKIAQERLRQMKSQKSTTSIKSFTSSKKDGGAELKKKMDGRKQRDGTTSSLAGTDDTVHIGSVKGTGGSSSVASSSSTIGTKSTTASVDPSVAKSAMLGQIGSGIGGLKKNKKKHNDTTIPPSTGTPVPRPSSKISGNVPVGVKGDKRWDRESKSWVVREESPRKSASSTSLSPKGGNTPKKSNTTREGSSKSPKVPSVQRLTMDKCDENKDGEEKIEEEEKKVLLPPAMPLTTPKTKLASASGQEETANVTNKKFDDDDVNGSQSSSPPPILVRVSSSPDCNHHETVDEEIDLPISFDQITVNSNSTSSWAQRPSARDIQATITAVENAPDEDTGKLAPTWSHSPSFEMAMRTSNSSWDRRPSSRDVMAKIRAMEKEEEEKEAKDAGVSSSNKDNNYDDNNACTPRRVGGVGGGLRSSGLRQQHQSAAVEMEPINEKQQASLDHEVQPSSSFEMRRKANSKAGGEGNAGSDDEISELSEPTIHSLEHNAFKGRSIPQALFIKQNNNSSSIDAAAMSPMTPMMTPANAMISRESIDRLARLSEKGGLNLPPAPPYSIKENDNNADAIDKDKDEPSADMKEEDMSKSNEAEAEGVELAVVEETEEQKQRRSKAEARAKKMEAIAARRNAGQDDDESAVSGISKRHRMRRKKKVQMAATQEESSAKSGDASQSQKSDDKSKSSSVTPPAKVETEEEKQRKKRAEARAKKLEAMAARRNAGKDVDDDHTAVSGISRRHRIRRKKSALAAITPEERWKKSVYASILNAEKVKWQSSIYTHVLIAEDTKYKNMEAQKELDELNAAAQRRRENQIKLGLKAKKLAARAERFHKIRREGGGDDDESVVSSASRMRRRRNRKSTGGRKSLVGCPVEETTTAKLPTPTETPLVEAAPEPRELTAEEKEKQERTQWCSQVYSIAIRADENQWKKDVYSHVLIAEEAHKKRMETQANIERERAAVELRKEKERQNQLRAEKMERIKSSRDNAAPGGDNVDDDKSVVTAASNGGSMKSMRNRRRRAAKKNASKK